MTVDLLDHATLRDVVKGPFDLVLHAAGMVNLKAVQAQPERAWAINVRAVEVLLAALERSRTKLLFLSSDNVFDGSAETYTEDDAPSPVNVYGETKVAAEQLVLRDPRHLVVRIPMLYGESPCSDSFLARFAGRRTLARTDLVCTPLYLPSLVTGLESLWDRCGLLHYGGAEIVTRFELMSRVQRALGLDTEVVPVDRATDSVPRPERLVLRSARHDLYGPELGAALDDWARARTG